MEFVSTALLQDQSKRKELSVDWIPLD
ncbi:unnamed protein product, partial [Allacma fusca]